MSRRFRMGRRRGMKRRTNWVPGLNFGEGINFAVLTLAVGTPSAAVNSITIPLTDSSDLAQSGGEGALLTRLVGRFMLFQSNTGVTPLPRFYRWAVFVADDANGVIAVPDLYTVLGLASENLVLTGTELVCGLDVQAAVNDSQLARESWVEIDTSVSRRLDEDKHVYLTIQSSLVGGTAATTVQASGFLRLLLSKATRG